MSKMPLNVARVTICLSVFSLCLYAQKTSIDTASRNPAQQVENNSLVAAHPAGKTWTQAEQLERASTLAAQNLKIRVDVFRVFEERDNDGTLLKRRAVFSDVQFYSSRTESHSQVSDPTPIEFMAVWVDDKLEFVFAVSSATYRKRFVPARNQWEHPQTPNGAYDAIYLNPLHHSKTYKPVDADIGPEMPFSVFIDAAGKELLKSWSGYAFHGTTLSHYDALGTPDSGGCIRMSREDAEIFFSLLNPKLKTMNRFGRWYEDRDPRNRPNVELVNLRERMEINVIDPDFMDNNPEFAEELYSRYSDLISYIYIEVNNNVQRTMETQRKGKYRTLTEKIDEKKPD